MKIVEVDDVSQYNPFYISALLQCPECRVAEWGLVDRMAYSRGYRGDSTSCSECLGGEREGKAVKRGRVRLAQELQRTKYRKVRNKIARAKRPKIDRLRTWNDKKVPLFLTRFR